VTTEITVESVLAKLHAGEPCTDTERAAIRDGLFDALHADFEEWRSQEFGNSGPEPEDNPDDCAEARADGFAPTCGHGPADHLLCGPHGDRSTPGCCPTGHQTGCAETNTLGLPWSA
jgi:hypothetical protein